MKKYLKRGNDSHQVFLRVQPHMMDLAHAHIDQVTINSFYKHIKACEDKDTKNMLTVLAQLYALDCIYENRGWYLENDYIDGSKAKAIRRNITKLYQEVKPNAIALVDAFDIPSELVVAPIASKEWS